jgi:hypothetical protein
MYIQLGHAAGTCSKDKQQEHEEWTYSMDTQDFILKARSKDIQHEHAAKTCSVDKFQHAHVERTCSIEKQHGEAEWTLDMQY